MTFFPPQPASAMGMLMPVTLTLACGRRQAIAAVASALIVNTIRKVSIASDVSQASTGTSGDPSLLQMLAKVSELEVPGEKLDLCKRDGSFHPSYAGPWERGHEILSTLQHTSSFLH